MKQYRSSQYPRDCLWYEAHFRTREPKLKMSTHAERWSQVSRFGSEEAHVRRCMHGHSFGTLHAMGESHPASLDHFVELGLALERRGRLPEAEFALRRALEGRRDGLGGGAGNGMALRVRRELASVLRRQGKHEEAENLLSESDIACDYLREPAAARRRKPLLAGSGLLASHGGPAAPSRAHAQGDSSAGNDGSPSGSPSGGRPKPVTLRELGLLLAAKGAPKDLLKGEELLVSSVHARERVWSEGHAKTRHALRSLDEVVDQIARPPSEPPVTAIDHDDVLTGEHLISIPVHYDGGRSSGWATGSSWRSSTPPQVGVLQKSLSDVGLSRGVRA
eukprot:TRINITY_DN64674_c0_g1_i1.p1 TRINITY_DN64674_c0_g1~~TRINITY_DN64674_c0_g1_i1.p1  ORF type:complete len:334 (+),score=65.11 TRINITY_DN64674_c0_g1_i1:94-1095(+)